MQTRGIRLPRHATWVAALAALLVLGACVPTVSESREVGDFSSLSASDGVAVHVVVGGEPSVRITASQNALPHVQTRVEGDRLVVGVDGDVHRPIRLEVTARALTSINASSSASVVAEGITGTAFDATVSSQATLEVRGATSLLTLDCSSQSTARLGGLTASTARVNLSSQARAEVRTTDAIAGNVSSQATLTLVGSPPNVDVSTSSEGTVVRH